MADAPPQVEVEVPELPQGVGQAVEMGASVAFKENQPLHVISDSRKHFSPFCVSTPPLSGTTHVQPDDIGPAVAVAGIAKGRDVFARPLHILSLRARDSALRLRATDPGAAVSIPRGQNPFSAGGVFSS